MATKILFTNPRGNTAEFETEDSVDEIVSRVNRALKADEKFIPVSQADGKKRGLEVANVIAIQET